MQVNEPSWRKPAGVLLILAMIVAWAVLVATVADHLTGVPTLLLTLFYVVAGVAWIFPARRILVWMELGRWRA